MEILNAILLLWAWIIIIFQVFFIKYLQKIIYRQNEKIELKEEIIYRDDKIISYYKQWMEYFREQLEKYEKNKK